MVLFVALSTLTVGQVMVSKVASGSAPSGEGLYYTLPKTVLKVNLVLEKIDRKKGPLASYAAEYLGVDKVINTDEVAYLLLNADVDPVAVADPDQMYFVQLPTEKSKDERSVVFHLADNGALLSVNDNESQRVIMPASEFQQTIMFAKESEVFDYHASYNKKKRLDTIKRKITIDTVTINRFLFKTNWVDKSQREQAEEAAQQISRIREARYNLLTGYHEVNFGESLKFMDLRLTKMERDYLELFLGKETSTIVNLTIFYTPVKGEKQAQIWRSVSGEIVTLDITTDVILKGLPDAPSTGPNNIYYRIPARSILKVTFNGDVYFNDMMPINQLGAVSTTSVSKAKLHFNPETGGLLSVIKD